MFIVLREEFKTVPKSQSIVSGDKVTLDCVPPRGYPEPKVYWAKDGRPISLPTNRIKLVPGGSLRINDVRPNDAGRYTCIAENTIGTKESPPAILEVSGKLSNEKKAKIGGAKMNNEFLLLNVYCWLN